MNNFVAVFSSRHGLLCLLPELVESAFRGPPIHQPVELTTIHEESLIELLFGHSFSCLVVGTLSPHPTVFAQKYSCCGKDPPDPRDHTVRDLGVDQAGAVGADGGVDTLRFQLASQLPGVQDLGVLRSFVLRVGRSGHYHLFIFSQHGFQNLSTDALKAWVEVFIAKSILSKPKFLRSR